MADEDARMDILRLDDEVQNVVIYPRYIYTPLPALNSIRIPRLLAETGDSPIEFYLQNTSLDDGIAYEALSYAWGDPNIRSLIYSYGTRLLVTTNLRDALLYMRFTD
jgi:hypothetical protein